MRLFIVIVVENTTFWQGLDWYKYDYNASLVIHLYIALYTILSKKLVYLNILCASAAGHTTSRHASTRSTTSTTVTTTTTTTHSLTINIRIPAILPPISRNTIIVIIRIIRRRINTNLDPRKQPILNLLAQIHILRERIVSGTSLLDTPHVVVVGDDVLRVRVVGICGFDGGAEVFGPEELTDLGDAAGACLEGVVGEEGGVEVGEEVSVDGAAGVVTREDGVKVDEAVMVGALDATEVG